MVCSYFITGLGSLVFHGRAFFFQQNIPLETAAGGIDLQMANQPTEKKNNNTPIKH